MNTKVEWQLTTVNINWEKPEGKFSDFRVCLAEGDVIFKGEIKGKTI